MFRFLMGLCSAARTRPFCKSLANEFVWSARFKQGLLRYFLAVSILTHQLQITMIKNLGLTQQTLKTILSYHTVCQNSLFTILRTSEDGNKSLRYARSDFAIFLFQIGSWATSFQLFIASKYFLRPESPRPSL